MREFLELSALIVFVVTGTAVSIAAVIHHALAADAAARRQQTSPLRGLGRLLAAPEPLARPRRTRARAG